MPLIVLIFHLQFECKWYISKWWLNVSVSLYSTSVKPLSIRGKRPPFSPLLFSMYLQQLVACFPQRILHQHPICYLSNRLCYIFLHTPWFWCLWSICFFHVALEKCWKFSLYFSFLGRSLTNESVFVFLFHCSFISTPTCASCSSFPCSSRSLLFCLLNLLMFSSRDSTLLSN